MPEKKPAKISVVEGEVKEAKVMFTTSAAIRLSVHREELGGGGS